MPGCPARRPPASPRGLDSGLDDEGIEYFMAIGQIHARRPNDGKEEQMPARVSASQTRRGARVDDKRDAVQTARRRDSDRPERSSKPEVAIHRRADRRRRDRNEQHRNENSSARTIILPAMTSRSVTGCDSTMRNVPWSRSVAVRSKLTAKISSG